MCACDIINALTKEKILQPMSIRTTMNVFLPSNGNMERHSNFGAFVPYDKTQGCILRSLIIPARHRN